MPVRLGEPESLAQVLPNHVPVQHVDRKASLSQAGLDQSRDRHLARAGEPREPDREAFSHIAS